MSNAKFQQPENNDTRLSDDAKAAIEAKRESLERVSNTEYAVATHAETLLKLVDGN
jgi:hypothetical protein